MGTGESKRGWGYLDMETAVWISSRVFKKVDENGIFKGGRPV